MYVEVTKKRTITAGFYFVELTAIVRGDTYILRQEFKDRFDYDRVWFTNDMGCETQEILMLTYEVYDAECAEAVIQEQNGISKDIKWN